MYALADQRAISFKLGWKKTRPVWGGKFSPPPPNSLRPCRADRGSVLVSLRPRRNRRSETHLHDANDDDDDGGGAGGADADEDKSDGGGGADYDGGSGVRTPCRPGALGPWPWVPGALGT